MVASERHGTPLVLVILGAIFSLTLKSVLDNAFSALVLTAVTFETRLFIIAQLLVFLVTLVRFYIGAYRYAQKINSRSIMACSADLCGTMLLFSGFYLCSLTVHTDNLFYWFFIGFLSADFLWFFWGRNVCGLTPALGKVVGFWQIFDVLTIVPILIFLLCTWSPLTQIISLILIFLIGLWDLWWFRRLYAGDQDWHKDTYWIKDMP